MKSNPVREKSYEFALGAIGLQRQLVARREFHLGRQFLRAATSVGANIEEALAAQSRRDFRAKMTLASKEAREAHYWLRLIRDCGVLPGPGPDPELSALVDEADQLIRILTSIVKTTTSTV